MLPFASWITDQARTKSSNQGLALDNPNFMLKKTAFCRSASGRGEFTSRGRDSVPHRPSTRARSADSLDSHDLPRAHRKSRGGSSQNTKPAPSTAIKGSAERTERVGKARGGMGKESRAALLYKVDSAVLLPYWYRLGSQVLIGRKPKSIKELQMLKHQKVTAIVSVVLPHEHEVTPDQVRCLGFSHMEIGVKEGEPLSLTQLLEGIRFLRLITDSRCGTVYVHCRAGRVRCVMLCVAFAMATQGLDPQEAEEAVLSKVPGGKLRSKHKEVLGNLNKVLRKAQRGVKGYSLDTR